jgi:hypothetical protein
MSIGGSDRFLVMRGIIRQAGEKAVTTKSQNRGNLKDLQTFFGGCPHLGSILLPVASCPSPPLPFDGVRFGRAPHAGLLLSRNPRADAFELTAELGVSLFYKGLQVCRSETRSHCYAIPARLGRPL